MQLRRRLVVEGRGYIQFVPSKAEEGARFIDDTITRELKQDQNHVSFEVV